MSDLLEQRLVALAERLDVRVDEQLVADVLARLDQRPARIERRPARRLLLVGAACVACAAIVAVFVPGPRHTIAHWFGIGSTRIETPTTTVGTTARPSATTVVEPTSATTVDEPAATTHPPATHPATSTAPSATFPTRLDLGNPTTAGDAADRTGLPLPLVPSLGPPLGIFVVSPPESGQIVVVYPPSATLPESNLAGIGALVSSMPGIINDGLFVKTQNPSTTIETLEFQNAAGHTVQAIWLAGSPHDYVFQDRSGNPVFDTLRLATNTLLWQDGLVTYRLEATVTREQAVELAATIGS
ncbi:MAG: hypothetical protein JWN39_2941 [Ilumatobacteraceae bacterium]|nr:hypothetical protein [Ilumatobacteraceae bacterium]